MGLELLIPVLLAAARWIFGRLADNAEKKKRIAKLITEWMKVMRKEFLASTEIAEEFEELWNEADSTPWQEHGVEKTEIVRPIDLEGK